MMMIMLHGMEILLNNNKFSAQHLILMRKKFLWKKDQVCLACAERINIIVEFFGQKILESVSQIKYLHTIINTAVKIFYSLNTYYINLYVYIHDISNVYIYIFVWVCVL